MSQIHKIDPMVCASITATLRLSVRRAEAVLIDDARIVSDMWADRADQSSPEEWEAAHDGLLASMMAVNRAETSLREFERYAESLGGGDDR